MAQSRAGTGLEGWGVWGFILEFLHQLLVDLFLGHPILYLIVMDDSLGRTFFGFKEEGGGGFCAEETGCVKT